jgi:hypothetical protein
LLEVASRRARGIYERGQDDHGGAVLIVVQDRHVELLAQAAL